MWLGWWRLMSKEGAFIVDIGIMNLPFPIRAFSRVYPEVTRETKVNALEIRFNYPFFVE